MIKKMIIIIVFSFLLLSCGKKADPNYEGNEIILNCGLEAC